MNHRAFSRHSNEHVFSRVSNDISLSVFPRSLCENSLPLPTPCCFPIAHGFEIPTLIPNNNRQCPLPHPLPPLFRPLSPSPHSESGHRPATRTGVRARATERTAAAAASRAGAAAANAGTICVLLCVGIHIGIDVHIFVISSLTRVRFYNEFCSSSAFFICVFCAALLLSSPCSLYVPFSRTHPHPHFSTPTIIPITLTL